MQQKLFVLSPSQEIHSRRIRPVFLNRGKLFEVESQARGFRLLLNIDRQAFLRLGSYSETGKMIFEGRSRVLPRQFSTIQRDLYPSDAANDLSKKHDESTAPTTMSFDNPR